MNDREASAVWLRCVVSALVTFALVSAVGSPADANPKPKLASISVAPVNPVIPRDGHTVQLTATGTYSDGSSADVTSSLSWITSNAAVAGVDAFGLVSSGLPGTATITAHTPKGTKINGSSLVTVTDYTSLHVIPDSPYSDPVFVAVSDDVQLRAFAIYTDGSSVDLTPRVGWSTSSATIASVDAFGLVSSRLTGTATITAHLSTPSLTDAIPVNVSPAELRRIDVTPDPVTGTLGASIQFTAVGTYSDNHQQNLPGVCSAVDEQVVWSSSDPTAVDISCGGLATITGGAPGDTITIEATTTETDIAPTGIPHAVTLTDTATLMLI